MTIFEILSSLLTWDSLLIPWTAQIDAEKMPPRVMMTRKNEDDATKSQQNERTQRAILVTSKTNNR